MIYREFFLIEPSDTIDLPRATRGIYVGNTGHIMAIAAKDVDAEFPVEFRGVSSGIILPIMARRIMATGTTANLLLALY